MATVLLIRGVSPHLTQEKLLEAFYNHAIVLASVIVRNKDGKCVGHAYVTVASDDVAKVATVKQIEGSNVDILPVDVDAWVVPPQQEDPPRALAPASATASVMHGHGVPQADPLGSIPSTSHPNLNAVLEQLREILSNQVHTRLAFNKKPFYMLLNECCQKRQWLLEASSAPGSAGAPFGARINVLTQQKHTVCTGHGSGPNKKDAKHNAAAACLDQLLGMEQLAASDLISAMTCPVTIAAAVQGGASGAAQQEGAGLTGGFPADPVNSAASLTHNVLKLGSYHRCAEVMRHVHSTEQGRTKTFLMVLNEYGVKYGLMASYELGRSASGNFYYRGTLIDAMGDVVAKEVGNKQEAKQAAAAALIDYMVAMYNIPVERFRSGKSVGK